ncbi:MAG: hypothetical protein U0K26_04555 [Prevotella pectinovora]|uniref:hypothetical protein n=1 Tax=Prevotella pectinovora TaxID=1602169 RepID=UPI002E7755C5|nr:hypothetical protein [Prevotella pectinovora]MEE1546506.1 hypothetical protein [Prevotella pectinovora]
MDKEYIQKVVSEFPEDVKQVMTVASVVCVEGLDLEVLCNICEPNCPQALYEVAEALCRGNWLLREHRRIHCNPAIADAVLERNAICESRMKSLLINLKDYLEINPLDDYLSRRQYFVAARLLLGYAMEKWEEFPEKDLQFVSAFQTNVILFASNAELSFHRSPRQAVGRLEQRFDFKLLLSTFNITGNQRLFDMMGALYSRIFRYDEATVCFETAEPSPLSHQYQLMYLSEMCWNLGLLAKSFAYAYNAFRKNEMEEEADQNIMVCLYISRLCALNDSMDSSRMWLEKGKALIGKRRVPEIHPIRIMYLEIEALLANDNYSKANEYFEKSELMAIKLYGENSPALSMISYIRYEMYVRLGMSRKSIEAYRDYVDCTHFNYGFSPADLSVLYSSIVDSCNERGSYSTAAIYEERMQDLHSDSDNASFAPGVRFFKALTEASNSLTRYDYELCAAHIEDARGIFFGEIKPDEETLEAIRPVFEGSAIPDVVMGTTYRRALADWDFETRLKRGDYAEARTLIEEELADEQNVKERLLLSVQQGRIDIKEGDTQTGIALWWDVVRRADASWRFEIAKYIAGCADELELQSEAILFYETALQAESMIYAKTKDLAVALRSYAEILQTYGRQQKSDELFQQAIELLKATHDRDGVALAFWYWGSMKQDHEAEFLMSRAIKYWDREGVFDETLSHMNREYALALGQQGKMNEARTAARRAVDLYPGCYPDYLEEEIEEYL